MMRDWSRTQIGCIAAMAAVLALLSPQAKAEERIVNFYNWSNYMAPGVLEDFTRETGIKVVYDTFDANERWRRDCSRASPATTSSFPPAISCSARSPQRCS